MPNDAEEKKIARLNFDVSMASKSLDEINEKLKKIAQESEKYSKTIGKNLGTGLNAPKIVADYKTIDQAVKDYGKTVTNTMLKGQNIVEAAEKAKEVAAYKSMLKQEEYNKRVAQSTESLYDKITQYAKTYVIYQGFNELRKSISDTIEEMTEVQYRMVEIDRVLNESGLDIDHYRDKLIQLAADYGNSFNNVADVTLRLAQAGFSSQEALALTEKTLLALNTAELNATQATGDMVSVMSQWGLMTGDAAQEAKDYGDIIDKINKVADNYPTTSADIMEALKKVSSAFNLAGASIDETIATIVAAEKASQRGGKVIGTALSNITQQLKAEGKLNLAEELGLDFFKDADKTEFKNIIDIFQEMADRMEQLKAEGKESSTEMQSLLELFTVFRRNVGASLLGEMSGEDNTYLNVLNDSLTATGYSLQENEKYMKTAKAAQAQFNAELLKLKTEVWDKGLEDVFRGMLSAGTDLVKGLEGIIKTFGTVPTSIGVAIAAFTAFNKKIQAFTYDSKTGKIALNGFFKEVADGTKTVRNANKAIIEMDDGQMALNLDYKGTTNSLIKNTKEVAKNTASLVAQKAATIALQAATLLLNTAISIGLSIAITALVGAIDDWIHADEKAIEKNKELMQTAQDNADKIRAEREERENLTKELENTIKKYNQLDADDPERTETATKLYELQTQINKQLEGSGKQISVINESLDGQNKTVIKINDEWERQIGLLNQISYQDKKKEVRELQIAMEAANENLKGISLDDDWLGSREKQLKEAGINLYEGFKNDLEQQEKFINDRQKFVEAQTARNKEDLNAINKAVENMPISISAISYLPLEQQAKYLNEWISALEVAKYQGKDVGDTLTYFRQKLNELEEQQETATAKTQAYTKALGELTEYKGSILELNENLVDIANAYDNDNAKDLINDIVALNKQYINGEIEATKYFDSIQEQIKKIDFKGITEEINNLQQQYHNIQFDGTGSLEEIRQKQSELTAEINNSKLKLEEYQRIFTEVAKATAGNIADIINAYNTGNIKFTEYSRNMKESAESTLDLYTQINNLTYDANQGGWIDSESKKVDEYANSLQEAKEGLDALESALQVFDKYWDTFQKYETATGEILVKQEAITTEMVADTAEAMNKILNSSAKVSEGVIKNIEDITGKTRDTFLETNEMMGETVKNISEEFLKSEEGFNATQNAMKNQAQGTVQSIAQATGRLLNALGEAIKNFNFTIGVYPKVNPIAAIANLFGVQTAVPAITFHVKGSGPSEVADALAGLGAELEAYVPKSFSFGGYSPRYSGGGSGNGYSGGDYSGSDYSGGGGDAEREAQEEYKAKLNAFKEFVKERERLEKRWVDKQKDLGLLSNQDYLYITQQRIERYKEYLAEVEKATWMSEEDRLALEKEYSEKIEDLETDYLKYYRTKLDDDIDALKKANEEKINLIKDEATERINALKKVEDENDRIRSKEEYEKRRLEHLEDISYWEQRTGRQAQEALKEAKKNLAELDEQWQEQMEDWSIEDQIKAIEEQRDAQIQAIEDAQEKEIQSIEDMYNKKLQLFAETGKIIYESSGIQSQALYNQYKNKFIDPLKRELASLKGALNPSSPATSSASAPAPAPQYIEYTVDPGDTLWDIAEQIYGDGSMWTKIYDENQDVIGSNPGLIYPGQVFNIPQFHQGGIFNPDEGLAVLKKNEMILKPEWSNSMEKLMKYFDSITTSQGNPIAGGNVIQIDGNLVNIQADIKNENDMNRLTKKIEKVLTDKFNIKK